VSPGTANVSYIATGYITITASAIAAVTSITSIGFTITGSGTSLSITPGAGIWNSRLFYDYCKQTPVKNKNS
jgi:hypothetical protein